MDETQELARFMNSDVEAEFVCELSFRRFVDDIAGTDDDEAVNETETDDEDDEMVLEAEEGLFTV